MTSLRGGTSPLAEHKPALHQPSDNTAEHMLKLNQSSDNTAKHTRPYCITENVKLCERTEKLCIKSAINEFVEKSSNRDNIIQNLM